MLKLVGQIIKYQTLDLDRYKIIQVLCIQKNLESKVKHKLATTTKKTFIISSTETKTQHKVWSICGPEWSHKGNKPQLSSHFFTNKRKFQKIYNYR